jgi:hypothetical protein
LFNKINIFQTIKLDAQHKHISGGCEAVNCFSSWLLMMIFTRDEEEEKDK